MKRKRGIIFTGIGFELVALILAAIFVGQMLEEKYPQGGLWNAGLIIVALIVWLVHVIVLVKVMERNDQEE